MVTLIIYEKTFEKKKKNISSDKLKPLVYKSLKVVSLINKLFNISSPNMLLNDANKEEQTVIFLVYS